MNEAGATSAIESTKTMMAPVLDKTSEIASAAKEGVTTHASDIATNGTQSESYQATKQRASDAAISAQNFAAEYTPD